jgi:hypothetical protein
MVFAAFPAISNPSIAVVAFTPCQTAAAHKIAKLRAADDNELVFRALYSRVCGGGTGQYIVVSAGERSRPHDWVTAGSMVEAGWRQWWRRAVSVQGERIQ